MNRIDRLVAILIHLQSKKIVTAREIANRFEISQRTVYRDIRALEEAGVPLGSEAGTGYFINQGYHLPPVMFTSDEAAAMLTAEKMIEKLTDNSLVKHYKAAMYKIKSVLRSAEKDYIETLDSHIVVLQPPSFNQNTFPNNYLTSVHRALSNKYVLKIEYYSNTCEEYTSRQIEPIGLCFYGNRWHIIAYCRLRNEYRDFRIDRIRQMQLTNEIFTRQHITIKDYFPSMGKPEDFQTVLVRFPVSMAKELFEQKYYFGFVSEKLLDNFIEMTFLSNSFDWIGKWLLEFGNKVSVISPEALKVYLKQKVAELKKHYL
jgi:predicted DNA-binding transcriptional regulator YafY